MKRQTAVLFVVVLVVLTATRSQAQQESRRQTAARREIPDKLVVLTFDDSAKTHFTVVRPLLKQYKFGASFFITEGFDFHKNKTDYMTWKEITQLHQDGFEIGNHTRDHLGITNATVDQLEEQLEGIARKCETHGIPRPITFAWPGNAFGRNRSPATLRAAIPWR
jgi:peptidoglycan/xylan/chitin deacetylase (PgdA/CDA1 family)